MRPSGWPGGDVPDGFSGIVHFEQEARQIFHVVLHHHPHIDDVQVAADHQGFVWDRGVGDPFAPAEPQFHASYLVDQKHVLFTHRPGPPPVEAGFRYRRFLHIPE